MIVESSLLIEKLFNSSLKFHLNLVFKSNKAKFFPFFYREIIIIILEKSCYNEWKDIETISVVQCEYQGR